MSSHVVIADDWCVILKMYIYIILLIVTGLTAVVAIMQRQRQYFTGAISGINAFWWGVFAIVVLIVGLRHEVGADWFAYINMYEAIRNIPMVDSLIYTDPAYGLINWFAAKHDLSIYFVNTVCASLFAYGLFKFCKSQPMPWLALTLAIPYLVTVVAMGYSRQAVAIAIVMLAIMYLEDGRTTRFVMFIFFAAAFHKSALVVLPIAMLMNERKEILALLCLVISGVVLFIVLLSNSLSDLVAMYIDGKMESSGALIRVMMNSIPAILFLLLRNRFQLSARQYDMWTWVAWGALSFVVALMLLPSSTLIDRLALYWIPLQLFVYSRLPDVVSGSELIKTAMVLMIVSYSALVLIIWLLYANNSHLWLPYQFYPIANFLE